MADILRGPVERGLTSRHLQDPHFVDVPSRHCEAWNSAMLNFSAYTYKYIYELSI
jgi:hypothetical protein